MNPASTSADPHQSILNQIAAAARQTPLDISINDIFEANSTREKIPPPRWENLPETARIRFENFQQDLSNILTQSYDLFDLKPDSAVECFTYGMARYAVEVLQCKLANTNYFSKVLLRSVPLELMEERNKLRIKINKIIRKKRRGSGWLNNEDKVTLRNLRIIRNKLTKKIQEFKMQGKFANSEGWFRKDRYGFIKNNLKSKQSAPSKSLTLENINAHFQSVCKPSEFEPLNFAWINKLPLPTVTEPFRTSPITAVDVSRVLRKKNSKTGSGPDGVGYGLLKNYPAVHRFLARMFNLLLSTGTSPASWRTGKTILIYKKGDPTEASNYRPITLTSCIGKIFHSIISSRIISFSLKNKIIDTRTQKGFIEAMNGCGQHSLKLQHLIEQQRKAHRALHIAWLDVENAYGSVRQELLKFTLERYNFPLPWTRYILNYYNDLKINVNYENNKTADIPFKVGLFQGCTLSCILFLLAFNPVLEFLKLNNNVGVPLLNKPDEKINCLAFADDLTIITSRSSSMTKLLRDIDLNLKSVGMKLKPNKCRTFSLSRGVSKDTPFKLGGIVMENINEEPMKFLGSFIFVNSQGRRLRSAIHDYCLDLLKKVDSLYLRGTFKLWIYNYYLTSCLRFVLTVHELSSKAVNDLESCATSFIKKWLSLPQCANPDSLYSPHDLNIKSLKVIYFQARSAFIADSVLSSDTVVSDAALAQITHTEPEHAAIINTVIEEVRDAVREVAVQPVSAQAREKVRAAVSKKVGDSAIAAKELRISTLIQQGAWLRVKLEQQADAYWASLLYDLPQNVCSWMVRSVIDVAPSFSNLKKWGVIVSPECDLCSAHNGTLGHIINACPVALKSNRFTWRHNSVLSHLSKQLSKCAENTEWKVLADLHQTSYDSHVDTITADVMSTTVFPDISITNRASRSIILLELTVPYDSSLGFNRAEERKRVRYNPLIRDLQTSGWSVTYHHIAVGSLGMVPNRVNRSLSETFKSINLIRAHQILPTLGKALAQISINCSYAVFNQRSAKDWTAPAPDCLFQLF